jgi:hypothetical protein
MSRIPVKIKLPQFKGFLAQWIHSEFPSYESDWLFKDGDWRKEPITIDEYCFLLPLNQHAVVKVYSSVDRNTDVSREVGKDSIKIVLAKRTDLKPIRPKFTHVYRIETWKENFRIHLREALESYLGRLLKCEECAGVLILKKSSKNRNFIGCSNFQTNGCRNSITL